MQKYDKEFHEYLDLFVFCTFWDSSRDLGGGGGREGGGGKESLIDTYQLRESNYSNLQICPLWNFPLIVLEEFLQLFLEGLLSLQWTFKTLVYNLPVYLIFF